jgi:uncharacterized membrane protein HdeD (DUF308 family)
MNGGRIGGRAPCSASFSSWPLSGLWVLGLVVGVDLILHGIWWITSGWTARGEPSPA